MKKSLVVLFIAVLALSAVFAADVAITVEGDVSASYVFDFDKTTGTYNVPSLNGALAWELVLPVAKAGSEYPYIDVAGEIEVDLTEVALSLAPAVDFSTFAIVGEDWKVDFLATIGTLDYAVSAIDTAKYAPTNAYNAQTGRKVKSPLTYRWASAAYYKNAVAVSKDGIGTLTLVGTKTKAVEVGDTVKTMYFKTASAAADYAALMILSGYGAEVGEYIKQIKKYPVTVKATAAVPATTLFGVEGESAELKLAESVTTQFGFGFAKNDSAMNAGFSTKSSYEDVLTVAADFGYGFDGAESFEFDVTSAFKYEMVSVDVYFAKAKKLNFYQGKDLYQVAMYKFYGEKTFEKALLSAKAAVEVEEIGTTFTFTGKDLLGVASLAYEAENTYFENYTFTFDASADVAGDVSNVSVGFNAEADYAAEVGVTAYAGVTASAEDGSDFDVVFETGIAYAKDGFSFSVDFSTEAETDYVSTDKFALTVKAGYEAETFTLSSAVEYNTHETAAYKAYDWNLDEGLYVTAGIESDKLVDGATLSLEYVSGELLDGSTVNGKYGAVTAAVTVEF